MILAVQMFARAKDLAGTDVVRIELPANATIADLKDQLARLVPPLAGLLDRCAFAVNNEIAEQTTPLSEKDEIALLPPVSGG
jgi:molybdopterin converting factor subunit 1